MLRAKTDRFGNQKTLALFCHFYSKPFKMGHSFISLLLQKLRKAYFRERRVKAA